MLGLNKLRINLTLMNTGVLIGLLLFIFIFLYIILSMDTETSVDNNLKIYSSQLANEIDYLERMEAGQEVTEEERRGYLEYTRSLVQNNISYIIFDQQYRVLDQSHTLFLEEEKFIEISKHYFFNNKERHLISDYQQGENEYKVCTYAVINKNGELKIVQVIKNMVSERSLLVNVQEMFGLAILIGASLSFLGGYFLSGRSLIPIKKSMERQQEFLADTSHELRTPIAVIQTNLEVVKASCDESVESQLTWIDNAYHEVQWMQHLVEDLMFLAKADSGELSVERKPIDLTYLIKMVTEKLAPLAAKKGITFYNELEDDLIILGDENQIKQLFTILLDNAIKYSDRNTSTCIKGKKTVQGGITVNVIDQGVGIPKDQIDRITQRFFRVDKVRSRSDGGSGLGLAIAKWIVDEHHIGMIIESEEHVGTKITLNFEKKVG